MKTVDLQKAIVPLIRALHGSYQKSHVAEAVTAMEEGNYMHCSKRLLGVVGQLDISGGRENQAPNFEAVVEAWKDVKLLVHDSGWEKTAERVNELPGMTVMNATYAEISLHFLHLASITTLMATEKRLGPTLA